MIDNILERINIDDDPEDPIPDDIPIEICQLVPTKYHKFLSLFSKQKGEALPPH